MSSLMRDLNAQTLNRPRLKHFGQYIEMMKELKDQDRPELEKVGQKYSISKFMEDFPIYFKSQIGVRGFPLSYVIRTDDAPAALEALEVSVPYSATNESFHSELEAHMSHAGVGWQEDNAQNISLLLSAVQTSSFVTSLKGYQSTRNGREA